MAFTITANVDVQRDRQGRVEQLTHIFEPYPGGSDRGRDARALAIAYLRDVAEIYRINRDWFAGIDKEASLGPENVGTELRFAEQKELQGTITTAFAQTHMGIPVWEAGVGIVALSAPLRVTSSHSTLHEKVAVDRADDASPFAPKGLDEARLAKALGLDQRMTRSLKIHSRRWRVYRYTSGERLDRGTLGETNLRPRPRRRRRCNCRSRPASKRDATIWLRRCCSDCRLPAGRISTGAPSWTREAGLLCTCVRWSHASTAKPSCAIPSHAQIARLWSPRPRMRCSIPGGRPSQFPG